MLSLELLHEVASGSIRVLADGRVKRPAKRRKGATSTRKHIATGRVVGRPPTERQDQLLDLAEEWASLSSSDLAGDDLATMRELLLAEMIAHQEDPAEQPTRYHGKRAVRVKRQIIPISVSDQYKGRLSRPNREIPDIIAGFDGDVLSFVSYGPSEPIGPSKARKLPISAIPDTSPISTFVAPIVKRDPISREWENSTTKLKGSLATQPLHGGVPFVYETLANQVAHRDAQLILGVQRRKLAPQEAISASKGGVFATMSVSPSSREPTPAIAPYRMVEREDSAPIVAMITWVGGKVSHYATLADYYVDRATGGYISAVASAW